MPPRSLAVLTSSELGLPSGTSTDLDQCLAQLPRELVILQAVGFLNALSADRPAAYKRVNARYLRAVQHAHLQVGNLENALRAPLDIFLEPFQQMTLLRRAFSVCKPTAPVDFRSVEGMQLYFDASRFAADATRVTYEAGVSDTSIETWLRIAVGMMPRFWLGEVPNANIWLARMNSMLDESAEPALQAVAEKLKKRFADAVGLSQDDVSVLMLFLSYWTGVRGLDEIYADPAVIRLNPETWLQKTDIPAAVLTKFFERTARDWSDVLTDSEPGGPLSHLPFRDRPFIRFSDGSIAAINPELVMEKLSGDMLWWMKAPDVPQREMWQADWGKLVEDYVVRGLTRIVDTSGGTLYSRVQLPSGEVDAVLRHNGHLALIEVTSARVSDAAVHSGNFEDLRKGLRDAFVERPQAGRAPYREAVMQLARDVDAVFDGSLSSIGELAGIQRIYPVLIGLDKRIRTPGVWHYLNMELQAALAEERRRKLAPLAVLALEDLEEVDEAVCQRAQSVRGSPPGFLKLLRRWDIDRGPVAPSWWQYMEICCPGIGRHSGLAAEGKRLAKHLEERFVDRS